MEVQRSDLIGQNREEIGAEATWKILFFSRLRRSFSRASRANFAATPLLRPAQQNRHATQAKEREAVRLEFRRKTEEIERESTYPTSLFPLSHFAISIIWTPGSRSKEKGESGDCSFFFSAHSHHSLFVFLFLLSLSVVHFY